MYSTMSANAWDNEFSKKSTSLYMLNEDRDKLTIIYSHAYIL